MATLTADTVTNILQIISDLRGESSTNTDANRIRSVSRAERDIASRMFFRVHLIKDQSIGTGDGSTSTFTIGTTTYPMRPKGLMELFVGGTTEDKRIQVVDFAAYKNLYNRDNSAQIAYEYYDQANDVWKVKVNRTPASGDAITGSWYFMPPKRTATTDTVIAPDTELVARLALAEIYESEDELVKSQTLKQECEQRIGELIGIENSPAVDQMYAMGAVENSIRNRGLGTY